MKALVIADPFNLNATRCAVSAATQIGEVDALVLGASDDIATLKGVSQVYVATHPALQWPLAENIAPLVTALAPAYTHIIAPATSTGKDVLPRIAALLDVGQVSDVIRIQDAKTFIRPIYAGNALEIVTSGDNIICLTIRPTAFTPAEAGGHAAVTPVEVNHISDNVEFAGSNQPASTRPDLGAARIIISGGRGIGSAENFRKLEQLADQIGAGVGASRAAVDAGYAPNDLQIGQTGKVVAPDLYIAVGISGAIQHLAGIKDSKVIVAINKDENAPIFDIADYGLVADWEEALPELVQAIGVGA